MMSKLRLLLAIATALTLFVCSIALANATPWTDSANNTWSWDNSTGTWVLQLKVHWQQDWGVGQGTIASPTTYELSGVSPTLNDPLVIQEIYNETNGWWTDWHIDITNGWFESAGLVANNTLRPTPGWEITLSDPYLTGKNTRLFAHVISGYNTQIFPDESLYLAFNYTASGAGDVKLTQYPTADMPIPEPASLAALATGLAVIGFRIKKRS